MSLSEQVEFCAQPAAAVKKGHEYSFPHMMRLDWDVLLQVMDSLGYGDFSRMSRTCQTLLRRAPRKLLSRAAYNAISIQSFPHFVSFCLFMLGGRHDGFQYLTNLVLRPWNEGCDDPEFGPLLATLLARATELEHLTLDDCEILELDRRVCRALASMPKLASLQVGGVIDRSFKGFKSLRVPALTEVKASFYYDDDVVDALPVFKPFRNTLRSLDLNIVNLCKTRGVRYPNVHTLSISMCLDVRPSLLAKAFPALQCLYFHTTLAELQTDDDIDEERWDNIDDQEPPSPRWSSLRAFHGSILDLYALGLRCTVDYVGAAGPALSSAVDERRLSAALADVRPSSLCLQLRVPEFNLSSLSECLAPAKDRLTELQLGLEFKGDMHEYPTHEINDMLKSLSAYNLRVLEVNVTWEASPERRTRATIRRVLFDEGSDTPWLGPADEEEDPRPAELDLEAMAYRAMKHSESLRFISISDRRVRSAVFEVRDTGCPESVNSKTLFQLSGASASWKEFCSSPIFTA
ncbi:hypothetical protein PsYK624_040650 [Phanerochaete sordida]|uniref:F-box domain-containing protein n=1 Tax=Phanerochaete sordida TaxID=48140 RepID=A0A9P3G2S0_9APHY|nr:hypothetical protein PsYK624_040650 [Phanerochaete sordida]